MNLELLDLLGPGYIADSLQSAVEARARDEGWRCYAGDLLRLIALSLGCTNISRYYDIIHPAPEDDRTAEEIAAEVVQRLGLKTAEDVNHGQ